MAVATQDGLDPSAVVLVREVPDATLASDARAMSLAEVVHADAIAVLTWPDAEDRRAHVHVFAARPGRWIDRDIEFRGIDAPDERGKTLGYAVAAMVLPRPEAPPKEPPPTPEPGPRETARGPVQSARDLPPKPEPAPPPASPPPRDATFSIDVVGTGSDGIGGSAGGFGSEASARWRFYGPLAARIGGGFRIGDVAGAQASSAVLRIDAGFAVRLVSLGRSRPVTIGLRADGVALYELLTRQETNGASSAGSRWQPAVDGMAELGWVFVPGAAFVAAGGAEVAMSRTRVLVDGAQAATIPRVRILGEFGIRASF
jgi:hypothetical protein